LALIEALVTEVHDSFHLVLPDGDASPWIPWRHVQKVFFPSEDEPIPALLLTREEPPQPRPLVLFFGSFRMTKEDSLPGFGEHFIGRAFVAAFLNAGYHVLIVDARAHGERKRAWERTDTLVRSSLQGLGKDELAGAISDASAIIDGIRSLSLYDESTRIGIVGTSWGGLQAMLTFSGDARIHCAVGVLPFMYLPRLEDFADLAHEPRVRLREPENWDGSLFAPRPIRLIVGEEDPLVDPQHIQQFIDVLRPAYTAASADDALQTVLLPGLGHTWDQREIDTTLDWLQRFLNP
jgi:dienelactone hydrolase